MFNSVELMIELYYSPFHENSGGHLKESGSTCHITRPNRSHIIKTATVAIRAWTLFFCGDRRAKFLSVHASFRASFFTISVCDFLTLLIILRSKNINGAVDATRAIIPTNFRVPSKSNAKIPTPAATALISPLVVAYKCCNSSLFISARSLKASRFVVSLLIAESVNSNLFTISKA